MNWRKRVLCTAVCDAVWAKDVTDIQGLRQTLDALLEFKYAEAPCLNDVIAQLQIQEMTCGKSKEEKLRQEARHQIAKEILESGCRLSPTELAFVKALCSDQAVPALLRA